MQKRIMSFHQSQRGAVLIIGLVLLLILTTIGMSGVGISSLQEKMAGALRDRQVAFQAAEAALKLGEQFVADAATLSTSTHGVIDMQPQAGMVDFWETFDWQTNGVQPVDDYEVAGVAIQPFFVVEYLAESTSDVAGTAGQQLDYMSVSGSKAIYRITARGVGATESAEVILQSTIEKE